MPHNYPILDQRHSGKKLIYLDAACTYLRSTGFIEASSRYYTEYSSCAGDRESSYLGSRLSEEIELTRRDIKKFLSAAPEDCIVFTWSTTDSINALANGLSEDIKTYLISDLEHNSNYLPWRECALASHRSFQILPHKDVFDPVKLAWILEKIEKPFVLSLTHASNIIGWVFDIALVSEIVHKAGGYFCVDDAQYVAHHQEDVVKNGIDFLAFSGHKIGWPTGIGVLYMKKSVTHLITKSLRYGGWTPKRFWENHIPEYKSLPEILEWGVQNFSGILGLKYAIAEVQDSGGRSAHVQWITDYFLEKFIFNGFDRYMEIESLPTGNMVTLRPKTFNAIEFHQYCNYFLPDHIIAFRTGTVCADMYAAAYLWNEKNIMRFSFGVYTSKEEIDVLFSALQQYLWL